MESIFVKKPEDIKPIYSPEVIAIIQDFYIKKLLTGCHILRQKTGQKECSDFTLIRYSLEMYKRCKEKIIRNKAKKQRDKNA